MRFEWNTPAAWNTVENVLRPDPLRVVGSAVSLGAVNRESALEWIHGLDLDASALSDDAYGRFPFSAEEVTSFLDVAGALQEPWDAAVEMTLLLMRLPPPATPLQVASSILDVWRHLHETVDALKRHGSHCACLMDCPDMPEAIRALDEATQRYYEDHHELPVPDCFGANDEAFQASLEPLIQRCADIGDQPDDQTGGAADALRDSQAFWDAHAARDPLWAVLSDAGKEGRRWDVRRFLQTGLNELGLVFYELESHGIEVQHGTALDFGCGVGRLTQALAPRFNRVIGVDVSSRMVDTAASLNQVPDRVSFVWNPQPDLRAFGEATFDFVYTNLVLQHVEPALTRAYLGEFLRVLKPGGVLVFQLPSHERSEGEPVPGSAATPMPDDAYQAAISLDGLPRVLKAAAPFTLEARVTNVSRCVWSRQAFGAITVGNHWLSPAGDRVLQRDDGRTPLPDSLAPGATAWVPLTINAPASDGEYQCEFDLAHEGVRWFEDRGSKVVRVPITVGGDQEVAPIASSAGTSDAIDDLDAASGALPSAAPGDLSHPDPGDFPMHGVHTDEVVRLIAASGGDVLMTRDDPSCGAQWVSYRYFVRKGGGRDVG